MRRISKKTSFITLILIIISLLSFFLAIFIVNRKPTYILQQVEKVDDINESNISSWHEVPIVSKEIIEKTNFAGEGGQWPLCLAGDSDDSTLIFYGTDVGGIFKSSNGGQSFKKANIGLFSHGICDIQVDPNNKQRVVCFGVNANKLSYTTGMYYSLDAGESWNFSQHFNIFGHRNTIEDLAYDPTSYNSVLGGSSVIYLSLIEKYDSNDSVLTDEEKGLYRSVDGGKSWQRINSELGDCLVKVDNLGRVFCGNYNGLFVSTNKGESFQKILEENVTGLDVVGSKAYILTNSQPNDENIPTFAKIYTYDTVLSCVNILTGGTQEDPNSGNTHLISEDWQWHYIKGGMDTKYLYHFSADVHKVYNLKVSPKNPNNMVLVYTNTLYYENASNTVLYSIDGGQSFNISTPNKLKTGDNADYHFLPYANRRMNFYWSRVDENTVFDFENDWLSKSIDAGKTFYINSNGINGIMCGGKFNFNLYDNSLMYFGSQDYLGAVTTDYGKTWKFVNLTTNNPLNDGANIYGGYAASKDVLFGVFAPRNHRERYLTISYDGGETANFVLDENHKITEGYVRTDGVSRMMEQANYSSYQSPIDKNILFCANLRSDDFGQTWKPMQGVTGVYASNFNNGTLYGINDILGQVVKSTDDGISWQVVCNSTDLKRWWNNTYISDLAYDETNNILYVTCQWNSLFKIYLSDQNRVEEISHNIPASFTDFTMKDKIGSDTFFEHRLTTVTVDPNNTNIVYVGGANYKYRAESSLFRSCDGGQTFHTINVNNVNSITQGVQGGSEPLCIRVNKSTGELWSAGNCLGFSKLSAPYETSLSNQQTTHKVEIIDVSTNKTTYLLVYDNRKIMLSKLYKDNNLLYLDKDCEQEFSGVIKKDMILYAKRYD